MSAVPILYSFRRCPYAMRARLALAISGTSVELREIVLRAKPAEMLMASPKGTVPVLLPGDGSVIDQSLDIMRWALRRNDPEAWRAGDDAALIADCDDRFKHHLDRYKYPDRHGADPLEHRAAARDWLTGLEHRLAGRENLCGATRTLADMAIMPFVRQFGAVDPGWFAAQPLPAVHAWLDRHLTSALFATVMLRVAPWQTGDPVLRWP
ncbi:glutathione S-transferase [Sphingomonas sp. PAMC 26617]|uniref:glutathione S-transferase n=1 Tax=Sphingomonas sp. PAMC 26617 TaxID=1112216 RepID=UPI000288C523|nr:glutathione S-transferase [Sphingomonas sp. PAMC 26617]